MNQERALEEAAATAATTVLAAALSALLAAVARWWVRNVGPVDEPAQGAAVALVAAYLVAQIDALPVEVDEAELLEYLHAGLDLGADSTGEDDLDRLVLDGDLADEVYAIRGRILSAYDRARGLADEVTDFDDVIEVVAAARGAANTAERTTRWAVNRAIASGVEQVADEHGWDRVWVAERDACLHCRGTRIEINPEFPAGLRREAEREVLRGRSAHASDAARVRAAARLLARGTGLPRTVQELARDAVRQGTFR